VLLPPSAERPGTCQEVYARAADAAILPAADRPVDPDGPERRILRSSARSSSEREGIVRALASNATVDVVAEVGDGRAALEAIGEQRPDVALLDYKAIAGAHIGLLSQRERIEAAGGTLRIESAVGNGTKVTVPLPSGEPPHVVET
jgi:hypothetical protein